MIDGIELCQLFERETPDGNVYLAGLLGGAFVIVVKDELRDGAWRVILSDPNRANNRNDRSPAQTRAQLTANDGWFNADMNDDIPTDISNLIEGEAEHE